MVFDVVHDLPDSKAFLREALKVLKEDGVLYVSEPYAHSNMCDNIATPHSTLLYGSSLFHCLPVSLFYGNEGNGTCMGVEKLLEYLKQSGFNNIQLNVTDHRGHANFVCKES